MNVEISNIQVGYSSNDLDMLVKGTLPQKKVLDVSPRPPKPDDIAGLLDRSMKLF
jgi:hydroxyacid-oxoacid transhydrogenase